MSTETTSHPPSSGAKRPEEEAALTAKPPTKKLRMLEPEYVVTVNSPHSFKSMCDIVSNVLINTHFHIVSGPKFSGIRIDSVDPSMVCMVKAKFACNVQVHTEAKHHEFCVRMKTLNTLLKHVSAQHVLDIIKYPDSPHVLLRAYDRKDRSSSIEFVLKTICEECEDQGLCDIQSKYTVEIDLANFKSICKMCKDIKASRITLSIAVPKEEDEQGGEEDGEGEGGGATSSARTSYFTIGSDGDEATVNYTFQSNTENDASDSSGAVIHATNRPIQHRPDPECLRQVYHESYSTEYLNLFMKSMEKQTIYMTIAPESPLILHYTLGAAKSYIRFVLAPKDKDE